MLATLYPRPPVSQAERAAAAANAPALRVFTETIHRDPPGPPTDNRIEQSAHFTGVIYTAICARMACLSGAAIKVMERPSAPQFKSKKARRIERHLRRVGLVSKALPTKEQKGEDWVEADPSSPWVERFEEINVNDTVPDFLSQWVMQYDLTGSTFLWCRPSQLGELTDYAAPPAEFYILPTALMSAWMPAFLTGGSYPYGAWQILPFLPAGLYGMLPGIISNGGAILDGRTVQRHRRPHPLYRWDGYSPLTAGGVQFDVLESIDQSRKAAMDHGFRPDVIATVKGATPDVLATVQAQIQQSQGGARNSRGIFLSNGDGIAIDTLCTEPREMDYGAGWDQMVKAALAILGVPPAVAGLAEATSYAQLYASLKQFHTLSMNPLAYSISKFLTKKVVRPHEKNVIVQIELPEIDDKDFAMKQQDLLAKYGAETVNELRGWAGMDDVEWGDKPVGKGGEAEGLGDPSQPGGVPDGVSPGQSANDVLRSKLGLSTAGGDVPRPANAAGKGSLPANVSKARLRELVNALG